MNDKESRLQCISFRERGLMVLHIGGFQCPTLAWAVSRIFGETGLFLTISVHVGHASMWDSVRSHFQVFSQFADGYHCQLPQFRAW